MKFFRVRETLKNAYYRLSKKGKIGWPLVLFFQWIRSLESQILVQKTSKNYALPKLDFRELQRLHPTPEVAFVLGKGPSRELLNQLQRTTISKHLSIGLNDTDFRDIVPTLEMRELSTGTMSHGERVVNKDRSTTTILTHVSVTGPEIVVPTGHKMAQIEIGPEPSGRFRVYSSSNLMTSEPTTCAAAFFAASGARRIGIWPNSVLTGSSASLLRAISLLLSLQAKQNVLIGVDLTLGLNPGSKPHPTSEPKGDFAPELKDVLVALNAHAEDQRSGEVIFLGHSVGALSPDIPTYEWS